MTTVTQIARKAVHDKIESQIKIARAKLDALKARAESAKSNAELKGIVELLTKTRAIDRKVSDLKQSSEAVYNQTKSDIEARVAELEQSVQAIEAKFKA
jgi:polyhydroxyalkanoate synthesis regulator phasin